MITTTETINPNMSFKILSSDTSVPFQGVPLPYSIENHEQLVELEDAMKYELPIVLAPVKNPEKPADMTNLCHYGVEMKVMKIIDLPDGKKNAFLVGGDRVRITPQFMLADSCFVGGKRRMPDKLLKKDEKRYVLTLNLVKESYEYVKNYFSEMARIQMAAPRELEEDDRTYLNFMIVTSPIDFKDRVRMLEEADLLKRAELILISLDKVKQQIDLRKEIFARASADMEREQRDHFLRAQVRQIQNEIGEGDSSDVEVLEERASKMNWSEETKSIFEKELRKLKRYNPSTPDYSVQYTYLDTLLNLPWNTITNKEIELTRLQKDLDKDHYGLEEIKERIIEHIAVLKLRGDMRSPILCLYGPPGVGKTSLCKSIADSLGRDYARISLGGLHDETQIRGHRRTYVGALPGRIIAALSKCKTNNPIFVLDEIDKIGTDYKGDPSQALLEVLDPEQNSKFHDNYLDIDYDLSKVFFIATANNISTISAPLLDRMELIDINGYLPEEKIEIAKRHIIPKLLENHGFKRNEIKFEDEAIRVVIDCYTRESGVRKLEKTLARVLRKIAVRKAKDEKYPKKINRQKAVELLGKEDIIPQVYEENLPVGVVAGLAWTPVGGEILYFESSLSNGKGNLTLTGNLGDVMKESATIALQWVKANSDSLLIDPERFGRTDVHLHVPEGAVPKDGPSAGITMVCSLVSSFTGKTLKERLAMTGEVTLSGKLLPVGGIKEKILAAKRAGITDIILSSKNRRDIEDIDEKYISGLTFHYFEYIPEAVEFAFQE